MPRCELPAHPAAGLSERSEHLAAGLAVLHRLGALRAAQVQPLARQHQRRHPAQRHLNPHVVRCCCCSCCSSSCRFAIHGESGGGRRGTCVRFYAGPTACPRLVRRQVLQRRVSLAAGGPCAPNQRLQHHAAPGAAATRRAGLLPAARQHSRSLSVAAGGARCELPRGAALAPACVAVRVVLGRGPGGVGPEVRGGKGQR